MTSTLIPARIDDIGRPGEVGILRALADAMLPAVPLSRLPTRFVLALVIGGLFAPPMSGAVSAMVPGGLSVAPQAARNLAGVLPPRVTLAVTCNGGRLAANRTTSHSTAGAAAAAARAGGQRPALSRRAAAARPALTLARSSLRLRAPPTR